MTEKEFRDKVREMRTAQKEFFRKKDQDILKVCKQLEKEVDQELSPPIDLIRQENQMKIF